MMGLLFTFIVFTLYRVSDDLEDPFDGRGLDDINVNALPPLLSASVLVLVSVWTVRFRSLVWCDGTCVRVCDGTCVCVLGPLATLG